MVQRDWLGGWIVAGPGSKERQDGDVKSPLQRGGVMAGQGSKSMKRGALGSASEFESKLKSR